MQGSEAPLQASPRREGYARERSTLAGFAEKGVSWHDEAVTEGVLISARSSLRNLRTLRIYVLSFLKRKYERKQFRRHILLKDHL